MSYQPLHHKYRPQTFAQLVGQEAIAQTLINAINSARISPAYLFTGPRGTGKTSSARILAKSLNCLQTNQPTPTPCGKCEVCLAIAKGTALDVIEIDAASNTGVDNIREIIERSQFAPVQCRYKVYVIDECHMLSTAAFNALLKTLEEPPDRIIFVLATTDPQRVLPTIISRCQRFDYRRISLESMADHLKYIAIQEKIPIEEEAITVVSQLANGGLRDAESLLDQLSLLTGTITTSKVWDLVGVVSEQDLLALLKAIVSDNAADVITQCRHILNRGREPLIVLQNLANFYLNLLMAKTAPSVPELVQVTKTTWQELCTEAQKWNTNTILKGQQHLKDSEVQIKNTTQPRLWLEITLLGLLPSAQPKAVVIETVKSEPSPSQPSAVISTSDGLPTEISSAKKPSGEKLITNDAAIANQPPRELATTSDHNLWEQVLAAIRPNATQSLVRQQCYLQSIIGSIAHVGVKSEPLLKLAKEKLKNIEEAFEKICQQKIKVHLFVGHANIAEKTINETLSKPISPEITEEITAQPHINEQALPETKAEVKPESNILNNSLDKLPKKFSSEEIKKAAENLAKFFDGEIILAEEKIEHQPQVNKTIIEEQSDISDLVDDEDLPF